MWPSILHLFQLIASHAYPVWAAVGPLVGVAVGAWLSARWQRQKWILDNKTEEFRSLFDALSSYRSVLIEYHTLYKSVMVAVSAQKKYDDDVAFARATDLVTNTFADRIFTRQSILNSGARDDWSSYGKKQLSQQPPDMDECLKILDAIHRKLVKASQDDLGLSDLK